MTGGGFGGCAVALIRSEDADSFVSDVAAAYQSAVRLAPQIYVTQASVGADLIM
jgi:galactokinase